MVAVNKTQVEEPAEGASRRVSRGIMRALESGQLAPGQRLIETDLAAQFCVGRNAVREAIQWLAALGSIEITRFRSAAIRSLDPAEALEVLDAAEALIGVMVRSAALHYRPEIHRELFDAALAELEAAVDAEAPGAFGRSRRHFYRALLQIGGNRELQRLFPAMGLHIVHAQYRSAGLRRPPDDFRRIHMAVTGNDADGALAAGRAHIDNIRAAILRLRG